MPVRWSAAQVLHAMEEIEKLLTQAQPYLDEAKREAEVTRKITYIPGYMDQRLIYLIIEIERFTERARADIATVRKDIPKEALKREQVVGKGLFD